MSRLKYFQVKWPDDVGHLGMAHPLERNRDWERFIRAWMMRGGAIEGWIEQRYVLRPAEESVVLKGDSGFGALQPEVRGYRLCSDLLREVLEGNKGPKDSLQWLPAWVKGEGGETRTYWVLHFPDLRDVLCYNPEEVPGVMVPVIYRKRVADRKVMASPDGDINWFVVTGEVREAILASGCEYLEFHPIRVE